MREAHLPLQVVPVAFLDANIPQLFTKGVDQEVKSPKRRHHQGHAEFLHDRQQCTPLAGGRAAQQ